MKIFEHVLASGETNKTLLDSATKAAKQQAKRAKARRIRKFPAQREEAEGT